MRSISLILSMITLNLRKLIILFVALAITLSNLNAVENDGSRYKNSSYLAEGDWYKISVPETGVYKLTYEDLKSIGVNNPGNVKIHGYGGWILPENFTQEYVDDLPEVSIWMSTNQADFGPGDYILFYARGSLKWSYSTSEKIFTHEQNPYSDESFYFITENENAPKLVQTQASLASASNNISVFSDYVLHEKDSINLVQSGREFYGEKFNDINNQTFNFSFAGITSASAVIKMQYITAPASSTNLAYMDVSTDNGDLKSFSAKKVDDSYSKARIAGGSFTTTMPLLENTNINLSYRPSATNDINTFLNYITINYTRQLKPYGAVTLFRSTTTSPLKFNIADATSNMLVFDVTGNYEVKKIETSLSASLLTFGADNSSIKEYALIDLDKNIPKPQFVGKVSNQDLHSLENADMVIIVNPLLQTYAEQLSNLHYDDSGLTSIVVNPEQIYNEFSSGKPDATAYRRFMKMFYDRSVTEGKKTPRYLMLFGDGLFDNKGISVKSDPNEDGYSYLLTFQSVNSLSETASYVSEDYFGFLEDTDGSNLNIGRSKLGIGRIPVSSKKDAANYVNKVKKYLANEENGIWQNSITFISDDAIPGFSNTATVSEMDHIKYSENYAKTVMQNYSNILIDKLYQDCFMLQELHNLSDEVKHSVTEAIIESLNRGAVVLNYVGHGSTREWTYNKIITIEDVVNLKNTKLPVWILATCDFSRFDESLNSAGEQVLLNPDGGGIALLTSTRTVYSSNNDDMTKSMFKHLFSLKEDGSVPRLGDIMKDSKNENLLYGDSNKLRFCLLGDPALKLNYPYSSNSISVTKINSSSANTANLTIEALTDVTVEGEIVDADGSVLSDFNGVLESKILDNEQTLKTLGQGKTGTLNPAYEYKDYINTLHAGRTNVTNGKFKFTFRVPAEILNMGGNGKMSFYAYDTNSKKREVHGYFTNYKVVESSATVVKETEPPVIGKIYLDDESFAPENISTTSPYLYAELSDNVGINTSNMLGRNISVTIDNKSVYDVTSTFVSTGEGTKSGYIKYLLPELTEGNHSLVFKLWDVNNNSTTQQINFTAVAEKLNAYNLSMTERSDSKSVDLHFFSDILSSKSINIKVCLYSPSGELQWIHEKSGSADEMANYVYNWNMRKNDGSELNKGIYKYDAVISIDGTPQATISEKLTISGQ